MAIIKESSKLTFYADIDIEAGQQLIFKTRENQTNYFRSKTFLSDVTVNKSFSYLRRGGVVKVGMTTKQAAMVDYLSFVNPDFENRVFYAKVMDYEYINNKTTAIKFSIDIFQTYMFDVNYGYATIEREHILESEYQKTVADPFRMDIMEMLTDEGFTVSKEMEDNYTVHNNDAIIPEDEGFKPSSTVGIHNLPNQLDDKEGSVIFMQISDFDTSQMTDIETAFYSKFDCIISSRGTFIKSDSARTAPLKVGRGFAIYAIYGGSGHGIDNALAFNKFGEAIEWITYHGLEQNVIGVYQISRYMWEQYCQKTGNTFSTNINYAAPRYYDVHNKKLLRFPYQYLRVYNNEGDCKEYKYEFFENNELVDSDVSGVIFRQAIFVYLPIIDNAPMVTLVPVNYRREGFNQEERIDCRQIPQIGYTTDSFLSFLSSQYNMNLASRTDTFGEWVNSIVDKDKTGMLSSVRAAMPMLSSLAGMGGYTSYTSTPQMRQTASGGWESVRDASGQRVMNTSMNVNVAGYAANVANGLMNSSYNTVRDEASAWISGGEVIPTQILAPAEAAFVADRYVPGSGNGTLGMYLKINDPFAHGDHDNSYNPGTYTAVRVKLRDEFLELFDRYLSGYGYKSGRIGIPNVCLYIGGKHTDGPHFAPFLGKNVTYVKTNGMHVYHAQSVISSAIEEMFNSGIQFLKGEDFLNE